MIDSDSDSDSWLVATTPGDSDSGSDSDSAPLGGRAPRSEMLSIEESAGDQEDAG